MGVTVVCSSQAGWKRTEWNEELSFQYGSGQQQNTNRNSLYSWCLGKGLGQYGGMTCHGTVFSTRNNYLTEQLFKLVKTNLGN